MLFIPVFGVHTDFVHQVTISLLSSSGLSAEGENTDYIWFNKEYTHTLPVPSSASKPRDSKDAYVPLKFLFLMSVVIYIEFIK